MAGAGHTAERSCIGCRKKRPQGELVRFVLGPDGRLLVDYRQQLPGRGAYTCPEPDCIAAAVRRRQFSRAFRRQLEALDAATLQRDLIEQLRERILGLLPMARKAGQVLAGSNLVLDALGEPRPPALILVAGDIAPGVGDKVMAKARSRDVNCWRCFDKETFGRLLGKEERSVVALRNHPLADSLHHELIRYMHIAGEN